MVQMAVHSLLFPEKAEGALWKKYFRLIYFERYLEFSNLTEPRQRVSSELCMAEKGRVLGVQEKALSAGPPAAFPWLAEMQRHNFPRLFLGTQNTVGVWHALLKHWAPQSPHWLQLPEQQLWSTKSIQAFKVQWTGKMFDLCFFPPAMRLFPRTHKSF